MLEKSEEKFLDKNFITAAIIIGIAYCLVIAAITSIFNKEIAGIAAVALTAIASAIFKQFEKLRFRQLKESEQFEVQLESPNVLLTLASSLIGAQVSVLLILFSLIIALAPVEKIMQIIPNHPLATIWTIIAIFPLANAIAYMGGTFYSVRALRIVKYSTVIFAVLIVASLQLLLPVMLIFGTPIHELLGDSLGSSIGPLAAGALPWLLYLATALWGARLARPKLTAPNVTQTTQAFGSPELQLQPI